MSNRPSACLARLLLPLLLLMPPTARADDLAQQLDAIHKLDAAGKKNDAYAAITKMAADYCQSLPLQITTAVFTKAIPSGFGSYDERDSNVFSQGDSIFVYMEIAGIKWVPSSDGQFGSNVTLGIRINAAHDVMVYEKPNASTVAEKVHKLPGTFFAYFYLANLNLPAGKYTVVYTLLDNQKHELAWVEKPIVVR